MNSKSNKNSAQSNLHENSSQKCKKLNKPVLNSTLRHKQQIEQLQKGIGINTHENKDYLLVPPTKFTTKLNFGVNHKLFENLTPINVNDSLLLPKAKISIPKKYIRSNDKIPPPDLKDFLEPITPHTYLMAEPQIKLEHIEYEFDVMSYHKDFAE